jgi:hypothetical protein
MEYSLPKGIMPSKARKAIYSSAGIAKAAV